MRDFSQAPFLVIWEVTQACDLACRHCRASAQPDRNPAELNMDEARRVIRQVRDFGDPLLVFTGGDPLKRADLFDLISESVAAGLRTTVTPSATPLLTPDAVRRFKQCGVSRLAVSLDGADEAMHDDFRQVAGSVRNVTLRDAYRNSSLFQVLPDSGALHGKCGACEYRGLCGGSRSRAYALTGDYLESDPRCEHVPPAFTAPSSQPELQPA